MISKYRKSVKQSAQSIKVKDNSLQNAGMVGGKVATEQLEGGQELQQASMSMYEASKPVNNIYIFPYFCAFLLKDYLKKRRQASKEKREKGEP